MNIWDDVISQQEQKAYAAAGFGRPSGIGQRPALLIIDVQWRTVGTERRPFDEAIKEFATSCGEVAWDALDASLETALQAERRGQRDAGRTEDFLEGVAAFVEKRKPAFKGQ